MAPQLILRRATFDEIPEMNRISKAAFGMRPLGERIWRRATPEEFEKHADEWYMGRMRAGFYVPGNHYMVVVVRDEDVEATEEIAGFASWRQPLTEVDPNAGKNEAEQEAEKTALRATWPACVDVEVLDAFTAANQAAVDRELGKEVQKGMWTPNVLCVHPKHQRKGVASMLLRWGQAEAEKSGTDIFVIATEEGRKAYLRVGFEDVSEFWTSVEKAWLMRWRLPEKKEGFVNGAVP